MVKIFSANYNDFLKSVNKLEKELKFFIAAHWTKIFPKLLFIKTEFPLKGNVRSKNDSSGSIDILAFNPETNRFVIIELKRKFDENIRTQADDYRDFIEFNFSDIYLKISDNYNIKLPSSNKIEKAETEIILIAYEFTQTDIEKALKSKQLLTLIRYDWIKDSFINNDLLVFDFINNEKNYLPTINNSTNDDNEKSITEQVDSIISFIENKIEESDELYYSKLKELREVLGSHFIKLNNIIEKNATTGFEAIKNEINNAIDINKADKSKTTSKEFIKYKKYLVQLEENKVTKKNIFYLTHFFFFLLKYGNVNVELRKVKEDAFYKDYVMQFNIATIKYYFYFSSELRHLYFISNTPNCNYLHSQINLKFKEIKEKSTIYFLKETVIVTELNISDLFDGIQIKNEDYFIKLIYFINIALSNYNF